MRLVAAHSQHMSLIAAIRKHGRNFEAMSQTLGCTMVQLRTRLQNMKSKFKKDPNLEGADILDMFPPTVWWTDEENMRFVEGVRKFGKDTHLVSEAVGTKSAL